MYLQEQTTKCKTKVPKKAHMDNSSAILPADFSLELGRDTLSYEHTNNQTGQSRRNLTESISHCIPSDRTHHNTVAPHSAHHSHCRVKLGGKKKPCDLWSNAPF